MPHDGDIIEIKRGGPIDARPALSDLSGARPLPEGRYGRFADDGRAFIVTEPAAPMPWVNVVCAGRFGFVVSHNGAGFSWLDDAQHNVLTRWEMDLVRDDRGKFLYLQDLDSGDVWSAAPAPCRPRYERYECEHGLGYTTFRTELADIAAEWTMGIAPEDDAEIWCIRVRNLGGTPRRLRLCSYLEWCCGAAPDAKREFHRLFLRTRYDSQRHAIVATKTMWDLPGGDESLHWNRPWPHHAAHTLRGDGLHPTVAITDKGAFLGRYGDHSRPEGLLRRDPPHSPDQGDAIAALGGDLELAPGAEALVYSVLAIAESPEGVLGALGRYPGYDAAERAIAQSRARWRALLGDVQLRTGWPDFDALNGAWLPYQALSGRLFGRTGYYQQSGAFGFRDQLQDSQVWLARRPERTLDQIRLHASRQFTTGAVQHWWHALADFGLSTKCSDDLLWLPFVLANYLRETGDLDPLGDRAAFLDDPAGATILEHARRAIARALAHRSPRGLPLIGSCDWNDGLSAVGVEGRGESVWLAFFLIDLLRDWSHIAERVGDGTLARGLDAERSSLIDAVNSLAWDGEWFRRATRDDGRWLGSRECTEGAIYLNPQVWAVMSDGASPARTAAAWDAVKRRLLTDYGPLLLAPAYATPDASIGYITRYPPGSRENGGVYTHAATWALAAACKMREPDTVAAIWRSLSPILRWSRDADVYAAEPYVLPGNSDGPLAPQPGRAGWTWYTGSAAWLNRISLEWVLGVRPTWEGLLIDPCPPAEMGLVEVQRPWHGRPVRVRFDAAAFDPHTPPTVTVNGAALGSNTIRPEDVRSESEIDVVVSWERALREPAAHTQTRRTTV